MRLAKLICRTRPQLAGQLRPLLQTIKLLGIEEFTSRARASAVADVPFADEEANLPEEILDAPPNGVDEREEKGTFDTGFEGALDLMADRLRELRARVSGSLASCNQCERLRLPAFSVAAVTDPRACWCDAESSCCYTCRCHSAL